MADLIMRQVHSVIDNRTTVVCLHAAGQIRPISEPFDTLLGPQDETPFHVRCRSHIVPYMKGFVTDIRERSNAELLRRPIAQRRIGPNGETGPLPPLARTPSGGGGGSTASAAAKTDTSMLPSAPRSLTDDQYGKVHDDWAQRAANDPEFEGGWKKGYTLYAQRMNEYVRGDYRPTGDEETLVKSLVRRFTSFFGRQSERMPADTIVWRGVRATDRFDPAKRLKKGSTWHESAWFSTSTSRDKANEFGAKGGAGKNWLYVVTVPKGARFVYGKATQREIVLPKDSYFDVIDVDVKNRRVYLVLRTGKTR